MTPPRSPLKFHLDDPAPVGELAEYQKNKARVGRVVEAPTWPLGVVVIELSSGLLATPDAFTFCHQWRRPGGGK